MGGHGEAGPAPAVDEDMRPRQRDAAEKSRLPHREVVTINHRARERRGPPQDDRTQGRKGHDARSGERTVVRTHHQAERPVGVGVSSIVEQSETDGVSGRGAACDDEEEMGRDPAKADDAHPAGKGLARLEVHPPGAVKGSECEDLDHTPPVVTARNDESEASGSGRENDPAEKRTTKECREMGSRGNRSLPCRRGSDPEPRKQDPPHGERPRGVASHHDRRVVQSPGIGPP